VTSRHSDVDSQGQHPQRSERVCGEEEGRPPHFISSGMGRFADVCNKQEQCCGGEGGNATAKHFKQRNAIGLCLRIKTKFRCFFYIISISTNPE